MSDPLAILGLICLGMVIAYAVPIGILLFKVRGSTIRLEGLRFVDRIDPQWVGKVDGVPVEMRPRVQIAPDYYSQSRDRGGDE